MKDQEVSGTSEAGSGGYGSVADSWVADDLFRGRAEGAAAGGDCAAVGAGGAGRLGCVADPDRCGLHGPHL